MKKIIIKSIILLLICIIVIPNFALANDINPKEFKEIYNTGETSGIKQAGGYALGIAQVVGIAVGVIMLIILGIKYMLMTWDADDKAKIKEKLVPYVIGAVIMFGATGFLTIVANFAQNMDQPGTSGGSSGPVRNNKSCSICGAGIPEGLSSCPRCHTPI